MNKQDKSYNPQVRKSLEVEGSKMSNDANSDGGFKKKQQDVSASDL